MMSKYIMCGLAVLHWLQETMEDGKITAEECYELVELIADMFDVDLEIEV